DNEQRVLANALVQGFAADLDIEGAELFGATVATAIDDRVAVHAVNRVIGNGLADFEAAGLAVPVLPLDLGAGYFRQAQQRIQLHAQLFFVEVPEAAFDARQGGEFDLLEVLLDIRQAVVIFAGQQEHDGDKGDDRADKKDCAHQPESQRVFQMEIAQS